MNLFIPPAAPKKTVDIAIDKKQENDVETSFNKQSLVKLEDLFRKTTDTTQPPTLDNLINNSDEQIQLNLAHNSALSVLNSAVELMRLKLDDIKADKLPSVIAATNKVVESIRRERIEIAKKGNDKEVHYHFYTPIQKTISDYDVVDVA